MKSHLGQPNRSFLAVIKVKKLEAYREQCIAAKQDEQEKRCELHGVNDCAR